MLQEEGIDQAIDLVQQGKLEQAKAVCETLGQKVGEQATLLFLQGAIAIKSQAPEEALPYLRRATALAPDELNYRKILADVLFHQGEIEDALHQYRRILAITPNNLGVICRSAQCLKRLGRIDDAITSLRMALSLNPAHPIARLEMARILRARGETEAAVSEIQKLSRLRDDLTFEAMHASWLLPVIPGSSEEMTAARVRYETMVEALARCHGSIEEKLLLETTTNFMAAYQGVDDRPYQEAIASFYRRNCPSLSYQAPHVSASPATRPASEKIRVGFLSTNFYNHTVGKLYRGIIAELDRTAFEVYVFGGDEGDEIAGFIEGQCDQFYQLPPNLPEARNLVEACRLDILVYADIGLSPLSYFLAFARLARVQCVGWGHPVTSGLSSIDYFISSELLEDADIEHAQSYYRETLWRLSLPPTYLYPVQKPVPGNGPDLSFAEGKTLYVCLQSLFKIHPDFDALLVKVLHLDPDGVCVFIDGQAGWSDILMARWQSLDRAIENRVHFLPQLDQNAFLALIEAADVILDTIFFCGGITSVEALSLGTPVVTWPNTRALRAKVTAAYYEEIGVTECIAESAENYVAIASRLGTDRAWRDSISRSIKAQNHLLFKRREVLDELAHLFKSSLIENL